MCWHTGDYDCHKFHIRHIGSISVNNIAAGAGTKKQAELLPSGDDAAAALTAAASAAQAAAADAAGSKTGASDESVQYLKQVVFFDKSQLPRKPLENFWLEHSNAPNKTFEVYRDKVATYLKSSDFQQRWEVLKAQVRSHSSGPCHLCICPQMQQPASAQAALACISI